MIYYGILNGVDYDVINPSKDQTIVKKYSARSVKMVSWKIN